MEFRNFARALPLLAAAAILVLPLAVQAAKPSGGGSGKVSVTAANPADAFQGEELDVVVSGSGFDQGSQVSYLVTGTTDGSQVEVLSVEFISASELKTRIRPKDAALPSEYDIEVQTSSGRKGKGTTLFRVKASETACDDESKEPAIAYLTGWETVGDLNTQDLYLSSRSGCDHYLLLEDAGAYLSDTPQNEGVNRFITSVDDLRIDVRAGLGAITWHDGYQSPWPQMGIIFTFDEYGNILPEADSPRQLYVSPDGYDIVDADVHITNSGEVLLVMVEASFVDSSVRLISVYNVTTDTYELVSSGDCHVQNEYGVCYKPYSHTVLWEPSGEALYFTPQDRSTGDYLGVIARFSRLSEGWSQPELLTTPNDSLVLRSVSRTGLLAYSFWKTIYNKRGKIVEQGNVSGILDSATCSVVNPCAPADGELAIQPERFLDKWTADEAILFYDQSGGGRSIREYTDPFTATLGPLKINDVDADFDSVQ